MSLFSDHLISLGVDPGEAHLTDLARYHLEEVHRHANTCRQRPCRVSWNGPESVVDQECRDACYVSPTTGLNVHICGWCPQDHPGVCMCPCGSVKR